MAEAPSAVPTVFRSCTNCRQSILSNNLVTHEAYCYRHIKLCLGCGELKKHEEFESHVQERVADMQGLLEALDRGDHTRIHSALAHGGSTVTAWRDSQGRTLLHHVAHRAGELTQSGRVPHLVRELLKAGSKVNATDELGGTPLHAAAKAGSLAVAEILLEAGSDACATSRMGTTPLSAASGEDMRLLLINSGAALRGTPRVVLKRGSASQTAERHTRDRAGTATAGAQQYMNTADRRFRAYSQGEGGLNSAKLGLEDPFRLCQMTDIEKSSLPHSSSRHAHRLRSMVRGMSDSLVDERAC